MSTDRDRTTTPEIKADRVLVSTLYSDGTPLPEGWVIQEVRPADITATAIQYRARRNGNEMRVFLSRSDVETYIRTYWASPALKAEADSTVQQITSPPKDVRPYGDAQFLVTSRGMPLPIGWVIRYHADKQEYVAYYQNVHKGRFYTRTQAEDGVLTTAAAERGAVLQAEARADNARIDEIIQEAEKSMRSAQASASAAKLALTALPEKKVRRSNRLLALGVLAGALVGGLLTGAVFAAQAPEQVTQEVTPVSCWQALTHADDLIGTYGSGLQASLETLAPRAQGLKAFSEDAARLAPLYEASRTECLAFKP